MMRSALLLSLTTQCSAGSGGATCNSTLRPGMSIGGNAYKVLKGSSTAACCDACVADAACAAFVTGKGGSGECLLKRDVGGLHHKPTNDCGIVRGTPGPPGPGPGPPPAPPAPTPPLPPGSPEWELVETGALPAIGPSHPDVVQHTIYNGFETGQYQLINGTYYLSVNELGMCKGMVWDLVTRAALWSATNSTGPWKRLTTLRNGSHIQTLCNPAQYPCQNKCGPSCCSGTADEPSFVTWAPQLIKAPSSVNESGKDVWNLFYSSNQNSHMKDDAFNGITWAVSTTDSMEGPYVDVIGKAGSPLPPGAEGVLNVAVNDSHAFSAWRLPNGSWAGFRNNIKGAKSFSAGLIVPAGDPTVPGGPWKPAGPNLASGSNCSDGFCYAPENPTVTTKSTDGKFYLAVYDALEQPPMLEGGSAPVCGGNKCNRIGIGFSVDGVTWQYSSMVAVQTAENNPCGQIRTPLGMVPEPERCHGCYSVLWTGIAGHNFRPICQAIIRNLNE